ncbi:hypothetical protein KEM55_006293, partial [Ascosphaera atra]
SDLVPSRPTTSTTSTSSHASSIPYLYDMTTPVDTLRDTDAPLIAHVSNIPYESLEEHGLDRSSSQADGAGLSYDENGEPGDSSAETALSEEEIERRKRIYLRYKASVLDQAFKDIDLLVYIEYGIQYYME